MSRKTCLCWNVIVLVFEWISDLCGKQSHRVGRITNLGHSDLGRILVVVGCELECSRR